jgi:hypothetical protein
MQFLPAIVMLLGLPVLLVAFRSFDHLVIVQRDRHAELWEKDGRPTPLWRRAPDLQKTFRTNLAAQRCALLWVLKPPQWAQADAEARVHLHRMRVTVAIWNFVVVPLFLLAGVAAAFTHVS